MRPFVCPHLIGKDFTGRIAVRLDSEYLHENLAIIRKISVLNRTEMSVTLHKVICYFIK